MMTGQIEDAAILFGENAIDPKGRTDGGHRVPNYHLTNLMLCGIVLLLTITLIRPVYLVFKL